jgi:hypothetical protein
MAAASGVWLGGLARSARLGPRAAHWTASGFALVSTLVLFLGGIVTGAVYGLSGSLAQALTTAVCMLTLWLLAATREAQRRESQAIKESLDALRESLRVTHALLEASELLDVEELRSSKLPRASTLPRPVSREGGGEDETTRLSTTAMAAI